MKLLKAWHVSVLVLLLIPAQAGAQIKGSTMGGLNAVVSDGPFDASRNPALLSFQKTDSALGAYVRYRAYDDNSFDFENNSGQIDKSVSSSLTAGSGIAYASKAGKTVLGFSFGDIGGDLYSMTKSKSSIFFGASTSDQRDEEESQEINPALAGSLSLRLSDHSSIGFQLITGYSQDTITTTRNIVMTATSLVSEKIELERSIRTVELSAGFGYLYNTPDSQVGFLVRSGTGVFEQEQMDMKYRDLLDTDDIPPGQGPAGDNSSSRTRLTPFHWMYSEGMNIAVGGYKRLSPLLAFALESVYTVSNSYTNQDFTLNEKSADNYELVNNRNSTLTRDAITLKGGVELNLSSSLLLTTGFGYTYFRASSGSLGESNNFRTRSEYTLYYATFGCHYSISSASTISFIANAARVSSKADLDQENFSIRFKHDLMFVDAGIGATTFF